MFAYVCGRKNVYEQKRKTCCHRRNCCICVQIPVDMLKENLRSLRTIFFLQNHQKIGKIGSAGGSQPKLEYSNALLFLEDEAGAAGSINSLSVYAKTFLLYIIYCENLV